MKAIILAAGLGTRLRPLTNDKPKALVEVAGKTLLEITINRLSSFGFNNIIINTHHFSDKVKSFISEKKFDGVDLEISDESELLLDTGGALKKAKWFLDGSESFLVHNVDILSNIDLKKLFEFHNTNSELATLAVSSRVSSRLLSFNSSGQLCSWKNVGTGEVKIARKEEGTNDFAFSGIHVVSPEIFNYMAAQDKFSIIDIYLSVAKTRSVKMFEHDPKAFLDVGKPEALKIANNYIF